MASATPDERKNALNEFLVKAKGARNTRDEPEKGFQSRRSPPKHSQKRDSGLMVQHLKQYEDVMKQQPRRHTEMQKAREREHVVSSAKRRYADLLSDQQEQEKEKPAPSNNFWQDRSKMLQDLTPASDREEQEMLEKALQLSIRDTGNGFDEESYSHLLKKDSNDEDGAHYISPHRPPQRSVSERNCSDHPGPNYRAHKSQSVPLGIKRATNGGGPHDEDFPALGEPKRVNGHASWENGGWGDGKEEQEVSIRFDDDREGPADNNQRYQADERRFSSNQTMYSYGGARPKTSYHQRNNNTGTTYYSSSKRYNGQSNWSKNPPPRFAKKQRSPTPEREDSRPFQAEYTPTKPHGKGDEKRGNGFHKSTVNFVPASKIYEASKQRSAKEGDNWDANDESTIQPSGSDISLNAKTQAETANQDPNRPLHDQSHDNIYFEPIKIPLEELFRLKSGENEDSEVKTSTGQRASDQGAFMQNDNNQGNMFKPKPDEEGKFTPTDHNQFAPKPPKDEGTVDEQQALFEQNSDKTEAGFHNFSQSGIYIHNIGPSQALFEPNTVPQVTMCISPCNMKQPVDEFVQPYILTPPAQYSIIGIEGSTPVHHPIVDLQFLDSTDDSNGSSPFKEEEANQTAEMKPHHDSANTCDKNKGFNDFQEICKKHGIVAQNPSEKSPENGQQAESVPDNNTIEFSDTSHDSSQDNAFHKEEIGEMEIEEKVEVVKKAETPRKYVSVSIKKWKEKRPDAVRYESETDSEIYELNNDEPNVNTNERLGANNGIKPTNEIPQGRQTEGANGMTAHASNGHHTVSCDESMDRESNVSAGYESTGDTGRGTCSDTVSNCSDVERDYNPEIPAYAFRAYTMSAVPPMPPFSVMPGIAPFPQFVSNGMFPVPMPNIVPPNFPQSPGNASRLPMNVHQSLPQTHQMPTDASQSPMTVQQSPNNNQQSPVSAQQLASEVEQQSSSNDEHISSPKALPKSEGSPVGNEGSPELKSSPQGREPHTVSVMQPMMPYPQGMVPMPGAPVGGGADGMPPRMPQGMVGPPMGPHGMVPAPQGMVPTPQGMVPAPQGMVPTPQGIVPMMMPIPQGMMPMPPHGMMRPPMMHPHMYRMYMYQQYQQYMLHMQRMGHMPPRGPGPPVNPPQMTPVDGQAVIVEEEPEESIDSSDVNETDANTFQKNTSDSDEIPHGNNSATPKHSPSRPHHATSANNEKDDDNVNVDYNLSKNDKKKIKCPEGTNCELMDKCDYYHPRWQISRIFNKRDRSKSENE